ncbi:MAG: DUF2239 family protein [Alsobacter sp.]
MQGSGRLTAFRDDRLLASGNRSEVARAVMACTGHAEGRVLVFEDDTGAQVDLDAREPAGGPGPAAEVTNDPEARRAGRPKLGVVSREVTLLPRHWDWLASQPGGASVTLRKLVDAARRAEADGGAARRAREAADRFMGAMLGNAPHYEEASRALYRGDRSRFLEMTQDWPVDPRDHVRRLAARSFEDPSAGTPR